MFFFHRFCVYRTQLAFVFIKGKGGECVCFLCSTVCLAFAIDFITEKKEKQNFHMADEKYSLVGCWGERNNRMSFVVTTPMCNISFSSWLKLSVYFVMTWPSANFLFCFPVQAKLIHSV